MGSIGFNGREYELAVLREEFERAASGRLAVVLIEGEAGIGKTRLARETGSRAESKGARVFFGRAEEFGARPFEPFADACACTASSKDPARAEIARLLAAGTAGHDPGLQHRVVDAFVDLIEREALERIVLLILDDLQWADASTLLTVRSLVRRMTFAPLLVVGILRPVPRRHDMKRFVDALNREGARYIVLGALADDDVASLARDALGVGLGPRLRQLLAGTGGNPLFVSEVLSILDAEGAIAVSDGRADVDDTSLPPSLHVTLLRRISYLPEQTLDVLRIAAVLGASFHPSELAAVTGRPVAELIDPIQEARRAGVLVEDGEGVRFRHDLIRDALYEDLGSGMRAALHLDAARKLAATGAPALRIAEHYGFGARPGDAEAVDWLRRAADETVSHDPAYAVQLLTRAAELAPPGDLRDDVRGQLATFHAYGGSPGEAESIARELLARTRVSFVEARAWAVLVHALVTQGRWGDVAAEAAIACARSTVDDATRGRLLADSALARMWTGDLEAAARDAHQAVRLGETTGDAVAACFGLAHLSGIGQQRGDFEDAVALAQRALEIAKRGGREAERRHPQMALGMALIFADRLRDAVAAFAEGRHRGERLGTAWDVPIYQAMLALPLYLLGEWDEAVAAAETALALADETSVELGSVTALGVLADIAVHRGHLAAGERFITTAESIIERSGPQWGATWLTIARGNLLSARGDHAGACEALIRRWEFAHNGGYRGTLLVIGPPLARIASEPEVRRTVADVMEEAAGHARVPHAQAGALMCRGLVDRAAGALVDAIELYRTADRSPDAAVACELAATTLARRGRAGEAQPLFDEALTTFEALGAVHDVSRVASRMRAAGIRRGVRGRRGRPTTGWGALTRAELAVACLVAEGLTNREIAERLFISRATVKTHLEHIFAKLGIESRRLLAAEVARRGT